MKALRDVLDKVHPLFAKGGLLEAAYPMYEALDTFLYTPGEVASGKTHVRDGIDLKRMMITVVMALVPVTLFGMWNVGYQANSAIQKMEAAGIDHVGDWHYTIYNAIGFANDPSSIAGNLILGAIFFIPIYAVCMFVGGHIELVFSVLRGHEINEGFLVTGLLFPLTLPASIPLWQVALGIAFGVIVAKEVFGGTGRNFLNVALTSRAFLYFAYAGQISGDKVWTAVDGFSGATALGQMANAQAGDIVAIEGIADVEIGDTIGAVDAKNALPRLTVDEPTLEMVFSVNSSPMVGREGKYVTTRQLKARLEKELERNVALRVEMVEGAEAYAVKGRGVLHLAILIETMRREGFELSVGKPRVIFKTIDGKKHEPFETLRIEVPTDTMGPVMELVGLRRGQLEEMAQRGEYSLLKFLVPSRGLIGLRTKLLNATRGTAIIHHRFESYRPVEGDVPRRANGVLISMVSGKTMPFAMFGLQDRSELLVPPGIEVYEGMLVGENARDNDMTVNPCREKKLTNIRAAGSDENVILKPPRDLSLEAALEYIEEDELVEVTPDNIRLRKIVLKESDRRRLNRNAAAAVS